VPMGHRVLDGVEFIHPFDTALDEENSDYSAYALSCYRKRDHLAFHDGMRPTVFHIRQLTHQQKLHRHNMPDGFARDEFTVRCGLTLIDNFEGSLPPMNRVSESGLKDIIARKWMDDANLGEYTITGLSAGIFKISELSLPLPRHSATHSGESELQQSATESNEKPST